MDNQWDIQETEFADWQHISSSNEDDISIHDRLNQYEIMEEIGSGINYFYIFLHTGMLYI